MKITIDKVDKALREILGREIIAFTENSYNTKSPSGVLFNRVRALDRAAQKCWVAQRPEDESTAVVRQALLNLSSAAGMIVG